LMMLRDSANDPCQSFVFLGFREKESARSARDAHLHIALFLPGGLEDGTELGYYTNTEVGTSYLLCSLYFTP
jgi:hypothetical protein